MPPRPKQPATSPFSIAEGNPHPLGVTRLPDGRFNFALFSRHATAVDLCLFEAEPAGQEIARVRLTGRTGSVWHGAVGGIEYGQHYGYRVHGPWDPGSGHRFNPHKLLLDPYARAISGSVRQHPSMCDTPESPTSEDSAGVMPKCVLVDETFDWGDDASPDIPAEESVIYELHVKGQTRLFSQLPENLRGTYAGLASDEAIAYLKKLGITTLQIMPVHQHIDDGFLIEKDLTNYWGYQTVGFFAPESRYTAGDPACGEHVREFKGLVKHLHAAGLEVILDVVYNHSGEQGPDGPVISFRGIDNASYYRHDRKNRSSYRDFTGCGNTLDLRQPYVLQMVLDSLRYWVTEMRVDGFRFDLAATLGRESDHFFRESAFFKAIQADPVLSRVKLIAEPWDLGPGGYQLGAFPENWAELNGEYRDCIRRFWLGEPGILPEFASRLTGSEITFAGSLRGPQASVNFLTSHDGFSLTDLVSYEAKHNEANGEKNRDGHTPNFSCNHGIEGVTSDKTVLELRDRHRRNLMATLLLSQGIPFILAGDEIGRTQKGNNNAYCQDNEISWLDWNLDERNEAFLDFTRNLLSFRKTRPELCRKRFFHGDIMGIGQTRDLVWYDFEGIEMTDEDWVEQAPGHIQALIENSLLLIFNALPQARDVLLPPGGWIPLVDTSREPAFRSDADPVETKLDVPGRCVLVFENAASP